MLSQKSEVFRIRAVDRGESFNDCGATIAYTLRRCFPKVGTVRCASPFELSNLDATGLLPLFAGEERAGERRNPINTRILLSPALSSIRMEEREETMANCALQFLNQ